MNEKQNIDRLFREKFKDFEVTPPEFVWENIEEVLREKKKRRVIPIWIKLSGVAAVLIIGTLLSLPYFKGIDTNNNPVVTGKNGAKRIYPTNNPVPNNGVIIGDSTRVDALKNSAVASENGIRKTTADPSAGNVPRDTNANNKAFDKSSNAVAHGGKTNPEDSRNGRHEIRKTRHVTAGHTSDAVAYSSGAENSKSGKIISNNTINRGKGGNSGNNANATQKLPGTQDSNGQNAVATGDKISTQQQDPLNAPTQNTVTPEAGNIKKNIPVQEAIAGTTVDTASVPEPENELEKLLQEQLKGKKDTEEAVAENSAKEKWNIKPQVAPVFYNSLSQGSPIDGQFAGNSKDFDNDLSYGVGINYAVTDRLTLRSGINTLNLSYSTNDVQFRASLIGETNNVSASAKSANIVVQSLDTPVEQGPHGPIGVVSLASFSNEQSAFNGSMIQKTGYIEVPVEMSYALVNRKFGIDVIGGLSTLFLNENNVSVVSTQGYSASVGEAQNLNTIHFSTNVGLGFKYRFWKSFQANFEPMFKYQVNAYSRDAGNFKPYFIGLYSGISFSF